MAAILMMTKVTKVGGARRYRYEKCRLITRKLFTYFLLLKIAIVVDVAIHHIMVHGSTRAIRTTKQMTSGS